jgi:hypothetical protein
LGRATVNGKTTKAATPTTGRSIQLAYFAVLFTSAAQAVLNLRNGNFRGKKGLRVASFVTYLVVVSFGVGIVAGGPIEYRVCR